MASLYVELTGIRLSTKQNLSKLSCELCVKTLQFNCASKAKFIKDQIEQEKVGLDVSNDEEEESEHENTTKMHTTSNKNLLEPYSVRCPNKNCRISLHSVKAYYEHEQICNKVKAEKTDEPKMSLRSAKKEYFCEECDRQFLSGTGYVSHLKSSAHRHRRSNDTSSKSTKEIFNCLQCDKSFFSKKNLKSHIESVHGAKKFECRHCDKAYARSDSLTSHLERIHKLKRFHCNVGSCRRVLFELDDLVAHFDENHKDVPQKLKNARIAAFKRSRDCVAIDTSSEDEESKNVDPLLDLDEEMDSSDWLPYESEL